MNLRGLAVLLILSGAAGAAAPATAPAVPAAEALARLKDGNKRFAAGLSRVHDYLAQVRATAAGQRPFAAVLSCMDSRTGPEIVFDQGLGDLLSVRVAGNVADDDALGSLEYATKVLGTRLIVVLGHTSCGAVKGACEDVHLGNLTGLLARIKPAVDSVPSSVQPRVGSNDAFVDAAARANVRLSIETIRERSPIIAALERAGDVKIVGAMYDVATGKAEFFESRP
jgi:carbonic anhydrase